MKRKIVYPLIAFILVFLLHVIYSIGKAAQVSQRWVQVENISGRSLYFNRQEFLLGFSYALAGAFAVYALLKFIENRKSGAAGLVGGVTLTGILYVGGCFLLGCCGSPMLAVYLGLFGSSFLGFAKPLVALMTTLSVVIGYFWIEKKSKKCCEADQKCCELNNKVT